MFVASSGVTLEGYFVPLVEQPNLVQFHIATGTRRGSIAFLPATEVTELPDFTQEMLVLAKERLLKDAVSELVDEGSAEILTNTMAVIFDQPGEPRFYLYWVNDGWELK